MPIDADPSALLWNADVLTPVVEERLALASRSKPLAERPDDKLAAFVAQAPQGWSAIPGTAPKENGVWINRKWRHPTRGYDASSFLGGAGAVWGAWNGAAVDGEYYYNYGGGHADGGDNGVRALHLASLTWSLKSLPTPLTVPFTFVEKGRETTIMLPEGSRPNGDGTATLSAPLPGHTYALVATIDDGRLFFGNPYAYARNAMYFDDRIDSSWLFDPRTGQWQAAGVDVVDGSGVAVVLPHAHLLVVARRNWRLLSPTADALLSKGDVPIRMWAGGYAPSEHAVFTTAIRGGLYRLDLNQDGSVASIKLLLRPRTTPWSSYPSIFERNGRLVITDNGSQVHFVDPDTGAFETRTYQRHPELVRVSNKVQYLPAYDAALVVHSGRDDVWIYRFDDPLEDASGHTKAQP